jgi:SAM-dependent methyltransferase
MGDLNQLDFARRHRDLFRLPALEVGSKDYGNTQNLRSLLGAGGGGGDYVGIDLDDGDGVDVVLDLTADFAEVDSALGHRRFSTIFCLSVLEHCARPFEMAANITRLLLPDGVAFVSVPHVWEIHAYPADYWRFTADGVRALFPDLDFPTATCEIAHSKPGHRLPLVDQPGQTWHFVSYHRSHGRYVRALATALAKLLLGDRQIFASTMINMIGRKRRVV